MPVGSVQHCRMPRYRDKDVEDAIEAVQSLGRLVNDLTDNVQFLLALQEKSLLISIRLAYLSERLANKVFEIEDDSVTPEQIEEAFKDLRTLFDEQQEILTRKGQGDGGD